MRLLNGTTRSVSVIDAGLRLLEQLRAGARPDLRCARGLEPRNEADLSDVCRTPCNLAMAGKGVIAPVWRRFLSMYPEVHLELQLGEAPVEVLQGEGI